MAMFQNPGAFFLGTLVPSEQKFLKVLLESARKSGYTKFVEPCAGAFAMSHLAVQSGFKPSEIESSDVSMFTSIMGYAGSHWMNWRFTQRDSRMKSCWTRQWRCTPGSISVR